MRRPGVSLAIALLAFLAAACSVVPIAPSKRPAPAAPTLAARVDAPRAPAARPAEAPRVAEPPRAPEPQRPSEGRTVAPEGTRMSEQLARVAGDLGEIQNAAARLLATARDQEEQLRYLQRRVTELSAELARQQEEQLVIQRRVMELSAPTSGTRPPETPGPSGRVVAPAGRTVAPGGRTVAPEATPAARGVAPSAPVPLDGHATAPSAAAPALVTPPAGLSGWSGPAGAPLAERTTSVSTAEDLHTAGLARYRSGDLDSALLVFYDLISVHPSHPLRESAQFLIGEILYAQRDARGALAEFEELLALWPNGSRTADGLLKIGLCLRDLGDEPRARAAWQRLLREHPNSPAARQARVLLKSGRAG